MFNFFSRMLGLNELRESNMKMLEEIQQLKNHISDLEEKTEKEINYDNFEIDYDELSKSVDVSDIEINYDDLASCLSVRDMVQHIDYDDLAEKIDASEIAECLDFTDGYLVETVAEKVLVKLIEHYKTKAK